MDSTPELNYLTQIMFMMYEDARQPPDSPSRFEVQVLYSPGVQYRERFLCGVGDQGHNPLQQSSDQELVSEHNSQVPPSQAPSSPSSPNNCTETGNRGVGRSLKGGGGGHAQAGGRAQEANFMRRKSTPIA